MVGEGRERERGGEGRDERGREGPHQLGGPMAPKHVKTAVQRDGRTYRNGIIILHCAC